MCKVELVLGSTDRVLDMPRQWQWAPWTIRGQTTNGALVLGPRLEVRRINRTGFGNELSGPPLAELIKAGFVVANRWDDQHLPPLCEPETANGLIIADKSSAFAATVALLLSQSDPNLRWSSVSMDCLSKMRVHAQWLVPIWPVEPRSHVQDVLTSLLRYGTVVWSGECKEGTHVGPLLQDAADVARYDRATREWCFSHSLDRLGFAEAWPNALPAHGPRDVAEAILAVLTLPRGRCLMVGAPDAPQALWTVRALPHQQSSEVLREQTWPKGLISDMRVRPAEDFPTVYIGQCRTPVGGLVPDLESNSGKGLSFERAETSTIGEAIERFAAWDSNAMIRVAPPKGVPEYPLKEFHPWGPPWEEYIAAGMPPVRLTVARSLCDGSAVAVPACLVPFPFLPPSGELRYTYNDTSGLACHPNYDVAVLRASLELVERHNLYTNLLHERDGLRLDPARIEGINWRVRDLLDAVQARGRLWLLIYPHDALRAPVVHAFWRPDHDRYVARGSGSGLTLANAVEGALTELVQVNEQFRAGPPNRLGRGHIDWASPQAVAYLSQYFDSQPVGDPVPPEVIALPTESAIEELSRRFNECGSQLLVISLPCPVPGWSVVRVLAPAIVTNQAASECDAGRLLSGSTLPYAIPT